jgi:hypothetical protein
MDYIDDALGSAITGRNIIDSDEYPELNTLWNKAIGSLEVVDAFLDKIHDEAMAEGQNGSGI